jgi:hypothetical protein
MPSTRRVVVAKWAERAESRPAPASVSLVGTLMYEGAMAGSFGRFTRPRYWVLKPKGCFFLPFFCFFICCAVRCKATCVDNVSLPASRRHSAKSICWSTWTTTSMTDQYGNQCNKDAQTRKQMADSRRSPAPGEVGVTADEDDGEEERTRFD